MLFAFDLVWLDGVDLRQTPLIERKKKLRRLIECSERSEIIYSQHGEAEERGDWGQIEAVKMILFATFAAF